ncbi:glycosyltransferase family 4 protein [Selenomonas sp. AB3002]|uniref:glycosyltransferase n=1 Tax=Selenomonas sp. AB3002 TaxID=1392502 RepID=UPI000494DF8B
MEIQVGINKIEECLNSSVRVFGYGAGHYGHALAWMSRQMEWNLTGFLVSNGEKHPDEISDYPVMQVSEAGDLSDVSIILAVNEKNKSAILSSLSETGLKIVILSSAFFDDLMYRYRIMDDSFALTAQKLRFWREGISYESMRVLFFTHGSELLGANRSLLQNLLYWQAMGMESLIVSPNAGDLNKVLNKHNIPSLVAHFLWWVGDCDGGKIPDNTLVVDKLDSLLKNCCFNLVYSNSSVINIGANMARKLDRPHIWHIREFVEEDFGWHFFLGRKEALEYILNNSNKAICISKALMSKCEDVVEQKNVFCLIPNGVSLDYAGTHKKDEFYQDVLRIGMCGFVKECKNQKEVLEALSLLPKEVLKHYEVEFYGPQDPIYQEVLNEYANSNLLKDRVKFLGYTTDVASHLCNCQIGVMASRMEAFGRVTVEYMLSGLLTIASNTGANPELLENGKYGLLYEFGNPKKLAECLIWCEKHRSKMQKMARQAQGEALKRFDPQRTAMSVYDVIANAINNK